MSWKFYQRGAGNDNVLVIKVSSGVPDKYRGISGVQQLQVYLAKSPGVNQEQVIPLKTMKIVVG